MKESGFFKKLIDRKIDRRDFLKGSAAVTAAAALGGCATRETTLATAERRPRLTDGKWIPAACWHNCGGRCMIQAYVVDGVPLRVKTDDTKPDTPDFPQQRACVRGRAQRNHVLAADRLKYPMKRKNWSPRGGGDKSLRGRDEWERISWDEAIDYIAGELNHARRNFGNRSIVGVAGPGGAFLNSVEFGGYTIVEDTNSRGSFDYIACLIGTHPRGMNGSNCRMELRRAETVILVGSNPAWNSLGNPPFNYWQAKEAGAKFIYVGPTFNYTADLLGARWIPVRPNTDVAMFLAVAHTMITEDHPVNNPIIDWDFLHRYTVGFDADHMPAEASTNENFKDYVLGRYDGTPKTPEWATEICGTPPDDIRFLARELRKDRKVFLVNGYAPARNNDAEDFPQIIMTIGAMGGHMGKSGHATGTSVHNRAGNNGFRLTSAGGPGVPSGPGIQMHSARPAHGVDDMIMAPDLWNAVIDGRYRRSLSWLIFGPNTVDTRDIDIRVLWWAGPHNPLETIVGSARGIEAFRKVDFVLAHALSMNATASHADIVLPITSMWERPGNVLFGNRDAILYSEQVMDRMYECKSDYEIGELIAHRLGLTTAAQMYPRNEGMQLLNRIAASTYVNEQLQTRPLVTITERDINEWNQKWGGVTNRTPQEGLISLKEFTEKGIFQIPRRDGDNFDHIEYRAFIQDPEKNPRQSRSGKFEIYCQAKYEIVRDMGRGSTIKPYPSYRPVTNGFESTFANWERRVKGPFPYQQTSPHYARRVHSTLDNVQLLREAFSNPCYINPIDAAREGVTEGDTVLISSRHGRTLRKVNLSNRLIPGTIELLWGPWMNINERTGIDDAGSCNYISAPIATGVGVSGHNSQVVNFRKYDGPPLEPDHHRPLRIVNI